MTDPTVEQAVSGTVVMVHGTWGHPDDWQWVRAPLEDAGATVVAVDLPSHRRPDRGFVDDAQAVADAVRDAPRPVVALGWSYGGWVVCAAAAVGARIDRLVLLGAAPLSTDEPEDDAWIGGDPHIRSLPDDSFVLDGTWWLDEADGATLPEPVRAELRRIGRRPAARGTLVPASSAFRLDVPTTVLYGRDDPFVSAEERAWAATRFDAREVAGDHFVLFRTPEVVSDLVLEVLRASR